MGNVFDHAWEMDDGLLATGHCTDKWGIKCVRRDRRENS